MPGVPKSRWHGLRRTPEYRTWADMRARCSNPRHPNFRHWGGRGITVCEAWEDFRAFYADMGVRPASSSRMTLERVDNEKGYSPDNCVWATSATQRKNTRKTRRVTIGERTLCLKDWCREIGIAYTTVQQRIYRHGWSDIDALLTPVDPNWRINNIRKAA